MAFDVQESEDVLRYGRVYGFNMNRGVGFGLNFKPNFDPDQRSSQTSFQTTVYYRNVPVLDK